MPAARSAGSKARKAGGARKPVPRRKPAAVEVSEQERTHLVDDLAFFHAERYRSVEGDGCREQDRREARVEIEAVIRRRRRR